MRVLALLLLGIAACYSPSYRDCEITCASGSCPSGFTCDQGVCRTNGFTTACGGGSGTDARRDDGNSSTVDADLFGDPDMDGVQYPGDNCPTKANPDQFDEDMDGMGDDCDPCPPFSSTADNKDSDGDGVGDGCDPSPITAGNSILVFAGFRPGILSNGGVATPPADWGIGNGVAGVSGTMSPNVLHQLTWPLPANSTAETVLTHYQLNQIGTSRPDGAGVVTQWTQSTSTGIVCWVGFETTNNVGNLKLFPYGQAPLGLANDTFAANNFYSTDMTRRGAVLNCSEKNAITNLSSQSSVTGPTAGVIVKDLDVAFDWVLIVGGQ